MHASVCRSRGRIRRTTELRGGQARMWTGPIACLAPEYPRSPTRSPTPEAVASHHVPRRLRRSTTAPLVARHTPSTQVNAPLQLNVRDEVLDRHPLTIPVVLGVTVLHSVVRVLHRSKQILSTTAMLVARPTLLTRRNARPPHSVQLVPPRLPWAGTAAAVAL